jgi:hypothetical protein
VRLLYFLADIWSSALDDPLAPTRYLSVDFLGDGMSSVNVVLCGRSPKGGGWKYHHCVRFY